MGNQLCQCAEQRNEEQENFIVERLENPEQNISFEQNRFDAPERREVPSLQIEKKLIEDINESLVYPFT